ncbi:MAG: hypothetical protein F4X82_01175 [Candidatus Spechtbacteria bacterium SB0662_bin_43]|uniref:Uncharacterized protein n=1 Tax=Candidatus Spechtbacteria bacterium SB0662_bin_43 TaxID=2604897 RepID=A0A845DIU9_9BACT|nr:hypothetical protein [Candidatus Spechtbacteria bacterium SB0662_bin_43]
MSDQHTVSGGSQRRRSALLSLLMLFTIAALGLGAFAAYMVLRSEETQEGLPPLTVMVQDHEGEPVKLATVAIEPLGSTDRMELVSRQTDHRGMVFLRPNGSWDQDTVSSIEMIVDVNDDGMSEYSAVLTLLGEVWVANKSHPWLAITTEGLVATLEEGLVMSEAEGDDSSATNDQLIVAEEVTTEETVAVATTQRSGSRQPQSQQPAQPETVAAQQERQFTFPVVQTLSGVTVSFNCGDTGVSATLESFEVRLSVAEDGRIVAIITVIESEVNPDLVGESFVFDLEENGFESSIRVDDYSLSDLRSHTSSMIREVGKAELENRRTAILEANDFRCFYGRATVERAVEHSCPGELGGTISTTPVVVTINRDTIENTPVITDGGTAGTYPLSAITVLGDRATGQQDADNFASAIADQVAQHRYNIALARVKAQCLTDQGSEDVVGQGDDTLQEDDMLEEAEDDLLEADEDTSSSSPGSGAGEPLPIMASIQRVQMYVTLSDGTRVDMEPFEAVVVIDPDLIVTAAIDNALVLDIVSYGLPESVNASQATQRFAFLMLNTLIAVERQQRAEAYASLHGITDYTVPK